MTALNQAPETKATGDAAAFYDDLRYTLEAYRATNDERLAELETRMGGDVLTGEKLARLDDALDETRRRLDRLTEWLLELDLGLKGGNLLPERVQVERLVVKLARPREADPRPAGRG